MKKNKGNEVLTYIIRVGVGTRGPIGPRRCSEVVAKDYPNMRFVFCRLGNYVDLIPLGKDLPDRSFID